MTRLWLVPVDEKSFVRTLEQPIDLTGAPGKPEHFPDEARVWGIRTDPAQGSWERNKRNRERMESGDPLLFYRNIQSPYTAAGRVGDFWRTEYVRDTYWEGGPAIDVYSVEEFREVDLSRESVNRLLGYETDFWPQGLWRVAEDRPTGRVFEKIF
jgi:hypothetical protein